MSDNITNYKKLSAVPQWALKEITGGRLSGKSDINPQWRYEVMTEIFGPCGKGWWYTLDKQWTEEGANGEKMAFCNITLYTTEGEHGIPSNGGAMLIEKESKGMHNNDEAHKMALTDAIGKAMQKLGVAAEVYRGTFGTKYEFADALCNGSSQLTANDVKLKELLESLNIEMSEFKKWLRSIGVHNYMNLVEAEKERLWQRISDAKGLHESAPVDSMENIEI